VLLKVEGVPWVNRCNHCEHEFRVVEYQTQCTSCGEVETTLVRGKELEIAYIEVEEQEVAAG
jgi:Zn finger protein HypA/HybF involved in hydrogenase expression